MLSLLNSQKGAIAAALPGDLSRALGASGLLASLGSAAAAATQTASSAASGVASTASSAAGSAARSAESAARSAQSAATSAQSAVTSSSSGFPTWAIVLIVIVVLLAIWWFMTEREKPAEPAKTGFLPAAVEYALDAAPSSAGLTFG